MSATLDNSIRQKVEEFVKAEKLFTSVDVGNALKKEGKKLRNREVASWLRGHSNEAGLFDNYATEAIDVLGGTKRATLYRPCWQTSDNYDTRSLAALKPGDVKNIQRTKGIPSGGIPSGMPTVISATSSPMATKLASSVSRKGKLSGDVNIIKSIKRIKVSAFLIQKLGWRPGDKVDPSKLDTLTPMKRGLYVNADGRVNLSRNLVGFGTDPVKVIFDNGKIRFEKA